MVSTLKTLNANQSGHPLRGLLIGGGVAALILGLLWLFTAHALSLLIDKVFTVPMANAASTPVGWDGVTLQFGSPIDAAAAPTGGWNGAALGAGPHILDLEGPGPTYPQVATATVDADNRLAVSVNGRSLVLGSRARDLPTGETPPAPIPAYAAEPGDVTVLTINRSWLSWPVFELNFMTGQSPTWRRDIYYHLTWTKRSGERLDLLWRFEQGFYTGDGWESPNGTEDGVTGLIRAEIQPAPVARVGS